MMPTSSLSAITCSSVGSERALSNLGGMDELHFLRRELREELAVLGGDVRPRHDAAEAVGAAFGRAAQRLIVEQRRNHARNRTRVAELAEKTAVVREDFARVQVRRR